MRNLKKIAQYIERSGTIRTYQNTADQVRRQTQPSRVYPETQAQGQTQPLPGSGRNFRLNKINEIQLYLESERDTRRKLSKKYQRGINVVTGFAYGLEAISVGIGVAGITLLTTVVAAPVVVAMEGVAIGTAAISIFSTAICDKILSAKVRKHNQIQILAESKLNTILDHISVALKDYFISDDEFTLILSELDKYVKMKEEIRQGTKKKVDDATKEPLIKTR